MNQQRKTVNPLLILLLAAIIFSIVSGLISYGEKSKSLSYSEVVDLFRQKSIESFTLEGSEMTLNVLKENQTEQYHAVVGDMDAFHRDLDELIEKQHRDGILKTYSFLPQKAETWYERILPYLLVGVILLILWFILMSRSANGPMAGFTKANANFGLDGKEKVTFADVAGTDEEKAELAQIVEFLKEPKKFIQMGARIPKGILLVGPPGTGKTLLARAVAGEADVSFLSISGSDFVELYVGVGASRVRDLFEQAKKLLSPAIIFIDEIDAVGRQRGSGLGGGHDEREQTLNQLLVEMDGFGKNEGVIVMAATNRVDILDPALLRPGRFDRQIYIGAPDWRGREAILRVHAKDKLVAEDVDFSVLAKETGGFTGADLSNLLNEAALLAVQKDEHAITMDDLERSIIKVIAGPEKKSRIVPEHERRLTAFHEAGHAVAIYHLKTQDPVHQITIVPRGMAGGMTINLPTDDRNYASKNQMFETIVGFMGGRVAEKLKLEDISTGASNDLERATDIAREMVTKFGMSEKIGPVNYESHGEIFIGRAMEKTKSYSEQTAAGIDAEIQKILQTAYEKCEEILRQNDAKLTALTEKLLECETVNREEFEKIMKE